jgi:hypothetical protein
MRSGERVQQDRKISIREVLRHARRDPAIRRSAGKAQPGLVVGVQNATGVNHQLRARFREVPAASGGFEQRDPGAPLQPLHLRGDGGGGLPTREAAAASEPVSAKATRVRSSSGSKVFMIQI